MKVKVTKKTAANNIELRDTVYKITLYSKNKEDLKDATELVRENIHYKLRDIKNDDYIESRTVLSDSLQYPKTFSDRPENSEVIEVIRGFNAKTTEADMLEIIMIAVMQSRYDYPEVVLNWEIYQAGSEMPDAKSADDKKLSEFHKRVMGVISDAYAKELNAVTIPYGYVKVVPNLEGTKYSEKKISTLAYYIMALIFASGGDYDTDVEATFVKAHLFPAYGLAAMPNSHII